MGLIMTNTKAVPTTEHRFFAQTDQKLDGKPEYYNITNQPFFTSKEAFDYIDLYKKGSFNGVSRASWNYRIIQAITIFTIVEP